MSYNKYKSMKSKINKKEETLPLSDSRYNKDNFREFCRLKTDWDIKSVVKNDLPDDISDETRDFIDIFRRKTAAETKEWNFFIDYENNEIIHCFNGNKSNVIGYIDRGYMADKKILSIHNHPPGTYSAPSPANFEILDNEFEDYEIICAVDEFWILEAKGYYSNRKTIQKELHYIFSMIELFGTPNKNRKYSENLINYINDLNQTIILTKKEYR